MFHNYLDGKRHGRRFARGGRDGRPEHDAADYGRHRRHGGGGRALARFFAHGDLRLVILNLIAEKPRHGYDIIKAVEDSVGGAYSPSPGVVYPTLTLLEELGYVVASADGAKRLYTITNEGRAFIEANRATLDALLARMSEANPGSARLPAIVRSMENLKVALRLRLARGSLTEAEIEAIAAAIDAAATKVEKA